MSARQRSERVLVWLVIAVSAAWAGRAVLAVWMAATAAVAAGQLAVAWRSLAPGVSTAQTALAAALLPLGSTTGASGLTAALTVSVVALVAPGLVRPPPSSPVRLGLVAVASIPAGLAASALVLARGLGTTECLVLLAMLTAYDLGSYLVGTGSTTWWEGAVAGSAALVPVTLIVAAVYADTFDGSSPWLLAGTVAVLAPAGKAFAAALAAGTGTPALRRLDSLLLAGPVWAWAAAAL